MWTYHQASGDFYGPDGKYVGRGYSGLGEAENKTECEEIKGIGPIPRGRYKIGQARSSPNTGPITMNLDPLPGTNEFGRSAFRMHGDNKTHTASHGCIILGPLIRGAVSRSPDRDLEVV